MPKEHPYSTLNLLCLKDPEFPLSKTLLTALHYPDTGNSNGIAAKIKMPSKPIHPNR